ncbi:MAG: helix-turn-helix domain-containing protein [Deltaproteobacteria bacterium]|nr:helix-turn-helix domain-containing protein [Deltaproteobacteria bacterium]
MESFGTKIRKIRKEKRLTLEKLSNMCGVDRTYISKIESGKIKNPYVPTLEKIANGLLVDVEVLYPFNNFARYASLRDELQSAGHKVPFDGDMISVLESLRGLSEKNKESYDRVMKVIQDLLSCFKSAA